MNTLLSLALTSLSTITAKWTYLNKQSVLYAPGIGQVHWIQTSILRQEFKKSLQWSSRAHTCNSTRAIQITHYMYIYNAGTLRGIQFSWLTRILMCIHENWAHKMLQNAYQQRIWNSHYTVPQTDYKTQTLAIVYNALLCNFRIICTLRYIRLCQEHIMCSWLHVARAHAMIMFSC